MSLTSISIISDMLIKVYVMVQLALMQVSRHDTLNKKTITFVDIHQKVAIWVSHQSVLLVTIGGVMLLMAPLILCSPRTVVRGDLF